MNKTIRSRHSDEKRLTVSDLPLLDRIYKNRGVTDSEELDYQFKNLLPFELLKDIDKAVALLYQALQQQQKILIVGDFDADGATSSALGKLVLTAFGAKNVEYLVPNRFDYGYGLTPELVEVAKQMSPDLIITVDNGISSLKGVENAKQSGIKVLITDHHLAGELLPNADAIVNPNQPDDQFPSKNLAGVGVVFYLLLALRSHLREKNWFNDNHIEEPNLAHYLDIVALGTVADVVQLDRNNRLLVHHGLKLIRAGRCRPGISALLKLAKRQQHKVVATDLGFAVGPRLNAAGRLDDMGLGIECLLTHDAIKASEYADILHSLNSERQQVEKEMQEEAVNKLSLDSTQEISFHNSVCLYESHWHQGVVGLIASRIKEKLNRPTIIFANADETTLKGSARSVPQVHIRDVLVLVDTRYPNLIDKFGGHAMAAGLSLAKDKFNVFQKAFDEAVENILNGKSIDNIIETDGQLKDEEFSLDTVHQLAMAGPFGQGFPEPLFDDEFEVKASRIVGGQHLKLTLHKAGLVSPIEAIAFRVDVEKWSSPSQYIRAVFKPDINEYYNSPELQLIIYYLEDAN